LIYPAAGTAEVNTHLIVLETCILAALIAASAAGPVL